MTRIESLEGASIALVAMGESQLDFHLAKSHSRTWDEVWGINAMGEITKCDRIFMLDPASRFLDSDAAGSQTGIMKHLVLNHPGPIYTCELDERCPGLVEFPKAEVPATPDIVKLIGTDAGSPHGPDPQVDRPQPAINLCYSYNSCACCCSRENYSEVPSC